MIRYAQKFNTNNLINEYDKINYLKKSNFQNSTDRNIVHALKKI